MVICGILKAIINFIAFFVYNRYAINRSITTMKIYKEPIYCLLCNDNGIIRPAHYTIYGRSLPYELSEDGFTIDQSKIPVCNECVKMQSEFRKSKKNKI